MFTYNHKIKTYPDGTIQHIIFSNWKDREYEKSNSSNRQFEKSNKELENLKRAKQVVYDLAKCNDFDYFITLTFDSEKIINRFDYKSCTEALKRFTKHLTYKGIKYIIVPELHSNGAYHFHGLLKGEIELKQAINSKTGQDIKGVFNIVSFPFGFSTASLIRDKVRVSTYITKYITKNLLYTVPKGYKRYWASKGLNRPIVAYDMNILTPQEIFWLDVMSDYRTESHNKYGDFFLFEYKPNSNK